MVKNLEKTIEVAGGSLILETHRITFLAREIRHVKIIRTIARLPLPVRLELSFLMTREEFLLSVEHIVKHL